MAIVYTNIVMEMPNFILWCLFICNVVAKDLLNFVLEFLCIIYIHFFGAIKRSFKYITTNSISFWKSPPWQAWAFFILTRISRWFWCAWVTLACRYIHLKLNISLHSPNINELGYKSPAYLQKGCIMRILIRYDHLNKVSV